MIRNEVVSWMHSVCDLRISFVMDEAESVRAAMQIVMSEISAVRERPLHAGRSPWLSFCRLDAGRRADPGAEQHGRISVDSRGAVRRASLVSHPSKCDLRSLRGEAVSASLRGCPKESRMGVWGSPKAGAEEPLSRLNRVT